MRRFSYLLLVLLYFVIPFRGFSQHFQASDFQKDVALNFLIIGEKRIEKGVKILNNAYKLERESIEKIESIAEDDKQKADTPEYKKAVKKLIKSSERYREGFMIIYTVYQEKAAQFMDTQKKISHYAAGVNKARFYEKKGGKAYSRAISIRDILTMMEKFDLIQYKMAEALELEKICIRDRGRALQIYQDFPVEYDYAWEDDVTTEQVDAAFNDPSISRPPDDLFVQKQEGIFVEQQTKSIGAPILFSVQIAAHTVPMTKEYIRENIYYGKLEVKETYEKLWYKYSIGEFDNFNDAKALLQSSSVKKSFVVAYQDGKKLTINEALTKIKANQ